MEMIWERAGGATGLVVIFSLAYYYYTVPHHTSVGEVAYKVRRTSVASLRLAECEVFSINDQDATGIS
jgi:hypothetical protein